MKFNFLILGAMLLTFNPSFVLAEEPKTEAKEEAKFCPVCGPHEEMEGLSVSYKHDGKKHYFCSMDCLKAFKKDPHKYLESGEHHH